MQIRYTHGLCKIDIQVQNLLKFSETFYYWEQELENSLICKLFLPNIYRKGDIGDKRVNFKKFTEIQTTIES